MKITVNNYNKTIRGKIILKDINLSFESGKIYGVIGKNGSGKTMLFRAISGLMKPTSGNVIIDGEIICKDIEVPKNLGLVIENPTFYSHLTGYENLMYLSKIRKIASHDDIVNSLYLVNLTSEQQNTKVKKYSLGMRQKLSLAQAFMENQNLIILDEPTNSLDDETTELVHNYLLECKKEGKLIIIASHIKEEINSICDELIRLHEGYQI